MKLYNVIYKGQIYNGAGSILPHHHQRPFTDKEKAQEMLNILFDDLHESYKGRDINVLERNENMFVIMIDAFDTSLTFRVYIEVEESDINNMTSWI